MTMIELGISVDINRCLRECQSLCFRLPTLIYTILYYTICTAGKDLMTLAEGFAEEVSLYIPAARTFQLEHIFRCKLGMILP